MGDKNTNVKIHEPMNLIDQQIDEKTLDIQEN